VRQTRRVRAHDPVRSRKARLECQSAGIQFCESVDILAEGAHALVLVTEWPQYQVLPWERLASAMCNPLMLDGRNALDREVLEWTGFHYIGMGRADRPRARPPVRSLPAMERHPIAGREMQFRCPTCFNSLLTQTLPAPG